MNMPRKINFDVKNFNYNNKQTKINNNNFNNTDINYTKTQGSSALEEDFWNDCKR